MKTRKKNRAPLLKLAQEILRRETTRLLTHIPVARLQKTPEAVHQVRVACRRLRAAIRLLKPLLPNTTLQLQPELKWLAQNLGPARDADVLTQQTLAFLENSAPPQPHRKLKQQLNRAGKNARRHMQKALQSPRCQSLLQNLKAQDSTLPPSPPPPGISLAKLIQPLHQKLLKASRKAKPDSTPAKIHRLRIHAKRLRYAMEFAAITSNPKAKALRASLIHLQDQLGLYQDAITSQNLLTSWAHSTPHSLPPPSTFLLGQLHQHLQHTAQTQLSHLTETTRQIRKTSWQSLKSCLNEN
ncbi:MAG: CHAD domain-containing protein [Limisphaerales bacterium]